MKHLGVLKNLIKNDIVFLLKLEFGGVFSVLDSDLEIREKRGQSSRPLDKGGGGQSPQKNFLALWSSIWSKNNGGPGPPSPGSTTGFSCLREEKYNGNTQRKTPLCKEGN